MEEGEVNEVNEKEINELILELSLASTNPVGADGRKYIQASAAASALGNRTLLMDKKALRTFEWTVLPLLELLKLDINNAVATKAAYGLRTLMPSRICMKSYIDNEGLQTMSRILDLLLAKKASELKTPSDFRSLIEHLMVIYREIARFYHWEIVNVGAIRHCVIVLRFGDAALKTIVATTLASLSTDLEICKQLFSYGAIKPILQASDASVTNDACMLAGLGCVIQLCRIPEIGTRMVQQGAIPVVEKALCRVIGHANLAIREKALYAILFLSRVPDAKRQVCTPMILKGLKREFSGGTVVAKTIVIQILMNVHNKYEGEREYLLGVVDLMLDLLKTGPWNARNLVVKAICVLYTEMEDREYFVEHGVIEEIFRLISSKHQELQEAPMVCLLYFCMHPDIPVFLLRKGTAKVAAGLLYCEDLVIRELAVILLKGLLLYNNHEVERVVPKDKDYLLKRDIYNPQLFGAEYGGMIQEYLQVMVENRRDQDYLIKQFTQEEIDRYKLTREELDQYQNTFMEIDAECGGSLDVDELKLLMVLMGEKMDKDEIVDLLNEYDTDHSGNLDFKEFVVMMKGWNTRFGTGIRKMWNVSTKRGAIGKSRRVFSKWWNKYNLEDAMVQEAKEARLKAKAVSRELELQFLGHEQLAVKREEAIRLRDIGFGRSRNYDPNTKLPPIGSYSDNHRIG